MASIIGYFSGSPPNQADNKRNISDVSASSSHSGEDDSKRPNLNASGSPTKTEEQSMVKLIERLFHNFSNSTVARLDAISNKLESFDSRLDTISSKLDTYDTRMSGIEERAGSQQLEIIELSDRVVAIESRNAEIEAKIENPVDSGWEPVGSPDTKIVLLGDSNSGGKIKFGQGKGTLGAALPGSDIFTPTVENLPDPDTLNGISDLILAVGTNNLKLDSCIPEDLAKSTFTYISKVRISHPSCHVFCPGVLPTTTPDINSRITKYNFYLNDMCRNLPNASYVDMKTFQSNNGKLLPKFSVGNSDPLHLNEAGLKVYFSRLKFALRAKHGLPNFKRTNRSSNPSAQPRSQS